MSLNTLPRVGAQISKEFKIFWPFTVGGMMLLVGLHNVPLSESTLAESPYKKELDLSAGGEIDYGTHPRLNLGYFGLKEAKPAAAHKESGHGHH